MHTFTARLEIDTTSCYKLEDYSILLAVLHSTLQATDYFAVPAGCANINAVYPRLTLHVYSDASCVNAHSTTAVVSVDLGTCIRGVNSQTMITCQNEILV